MAPIVLEGETLGKRHQFYNILLKEAIADGRPIESTKVEFEENDIDNLIKIDLASHYRNIDFILEVLKCEDMLYVSRVIKRCSWLITDKQHESIINPEYLNNVLFPAMTSKAINKLTLHIRLNLKDESRVENFYNYYKGEKIPDGLKWLQNCSIAFIEKEVEENIEIIDFHLLKRLCKKSITILDIIEKKSQSKPVHLEKLLCLLNSHTEKYLDILDRLGKNELINLNLKQTEVIMKKYPHRVFDKFEHYATMVDLKTIVKYISKDEVKDFLIRYKDNESLRFLFNFDNLKHFINRMPKKDRFDFVKTMFIDKELINKQKPRGEGFFCSDLCDVKVYRWYNYAPFNLAFPELKKLIRTETNAEERVAIMTVLLNCAKRDMNNIYLFLQYYREKHINEPYKYKSQVINKILLLTDTHKYNDRTWKLLDEIFHSMDVYTKSDRNVQSCIQAIIVYKILHKVDIPKVIEEQFIFSSLNRYVSKLNKEENDLLFNCLLTILKNKIECIKLQSREELYEMLELLTTTLSLLKYCNKDILDHPWILHNIKELILQKSKNSWDESLCALYNINKDWRKQLFEESLQLNPTGPVILNALKHDPTLLTRYQCDFKILFSSDTVELRQFLSKLRIYWPQTLAKDWITIFQDRLYLPDGLNVIIRGLFVLLHKKDVLDMIKKYEPIDSKINWSENDEIILSLRKNIAKTMYFIRPHPPPSAILGYARGDYLQYLAPSLCAIFDNLSIVSSRKCVVSLLNEPVSLQKHSIRLAFNKLGTEECKEIFSNVWNATSNPTIRAVLFELTFKILCKEKRATELKSIWELLSMFIDNLTCDESSKIYDILGDISEIPYLVRGQCAVKSYTFLKTLPAKPDCERRIRRVITDMAQIIELLHSDFVEGILEVFVEKEFMKKQILRDDCYIQLLSAYLLYSKDEVSANKKYKKVLIKLVDNTINLWNEMIDKEYFIRNNFEELTHRICGDVIPIIAKKKVIFPLKMFEIIKNKLELISLHENYVIIRSWKLSVGFIEVLENHKAILYEMETKDHVKQNRRHGLARGQYNESWDELYFAAAQDFGEKCLKYLQEDVNTIHPSVMRLYSKAMRKFIENLFNIPYLVKVEILKHMLGNKDFIESYLFVLKNLPLYVEYDEKLKRKTLEIRNILISNTSPLFSMHYYARFNEPMQ